MYLNFYKKNIMSLKITKKKAALVGELENKILAEQWQDVSDKLSLSSVGGNAFFIGTHVASDVSWFKLRFLLACL